MTLTKEMAAGRHKRNHQNWSIEEELEEESTIGNWISQDSSGASYALGEDVVSAVTEVLDHEQ